MDFCTSDYVSDDLAVAAAIASLPGGGYTGTGGWVELGPGTYDFVNGVGSNALHNVRISGAGLATQVRWKNSNVFANPTPMTNYLFTTGDFCLLDNMQLVGYSNFKCPINGINTVNSGTGTNTLGGGIQITGGRVWLSHIYVTGMAEDGITNNGGIGAKYHDVEIIGCGGTGLSLTGYLNGTVYATDNDMSSVWIGSCGYGMTIANGGLWIAGAHIWGCQNDGIQLNSDSVRVLGCYIENNGGWGVNINSRSNCVVSGNDIWANGLAYTYAAPLGGVIVAGGKYNHITDNNFRDNRYHAVLLNSTAFDNIVKDNTGTDAIGYNIGADTAISYTASGTQVTTTSFTDANAPAWMKTANTALGMTIAIAGAGNAGATLTAQVVGWVSTTEVTLSFAQVTATTNPVYSVHAMAYGVREAGSATRNLVKDNNFRTAQLAAVILGQAVGRNSRSEGNKAIDEMSWFEAGTASSGSLGPDVRSGTLYHATLAANVTAITFFSGQLVRGTEFVISLTQDATGGRTVTGWPSNVKFGSAGAPTINPAAGSTSTLRFRYDGTNWIETGRTV